MSRMMPTECDRCGGVADWGDFGPNPTTGTICECICECICEWQRVQRLTGPVTEVLHHPECRFHGTVAEPETWADWLGSVGKMVTGP